MSDLDLIYLIMFLLWIMLVVLLYLVWGLPKRLYEDIKGRLKAEIQSYIEKNQRKK